jgi:DNA-binding TFAR19-related protein (PDSD5 family)
VVGSLAYLAQSGKAGAGKITDKQLYELLSRLTQKRETSIEFKSK